MFSEGGVMFVICPKCKKVNEWETLTSLGLIVTNEKFLKEETELECVHCSQLFTIKKDSFVAGVECKSQTEE